jgi:hypothetical protein
MSGFIENLSLAWTGDFVSLEQFSSEVLNLDGEWTQPRGDRKLFTFGNSTMVWRRNKNLLTINGERSEEIKKRVCKVMLKDSITLSTLPSQAQSSMTTDAYFDDIKSLKEGQMLNCEIIQSLAESVSDLASVISRVQGNEVENNSNFNKNTEKSDVEQSEYANFANTNFNKNTEKSNVEQSEYANFANTKSCFVLEELTDPLMNNNNSNDRISLMKENDLESNDNDMSYTNLNESNTGTSLLNAQQKSTYAEVVKSSSGLESPSNITTCTVKATEKGNNQGKLDKILDCDSSDGFIGIEHKQRKFKQFFLSGIADQVNESQIISYLAKRNIT